MPIKVFCLLLLCMCDLYRGMNMPWSPCGGQKTSLWCQFSLSTFMWVLGITGVGEDIFHPLSYPSGPSYISWIPFYLDEKHLLFLVIIEYFSGVGMWSVVWENESKVLHILVQNCTTNLHPQHLKTFFTIGCWILSKTFITLILSGFPLYPVNMLAYLKWLSNM